MAIPLEINSQSILHEASGQAWCAPERGQYALVEGDPEAARRTTQALTEGEPLPNALAAANARLFKHGETVAVAALEISGRRALAAATGPASVLLVRGERISRLCGSEEGHGLGASPWPHVSSAPLPLRPMDRLLLTSGNLLARVPAARVWERLSQSATLEGALRKLIEDAGADGPLSLFAVQLVPRPARFFDKIHWYVYRQVAV